MRLWCGYGYGCVQFVFSTSRLCPHTITTKGRSQFTKDLHNLSPESHDPWPCNTTIDASSKHYCVQFQTKIWVVDGIHKRAQHMAEDKAEQATYIAHNQPIPRTTLCSCRILTPYSMESIDGLFKSPSPLNYSTQFLPWHQSLTHLAPCPRPPPP